MPKRLPSIPARSNPIAHSPFRPFPDSPHSPFRPVAPSPRRRFAHTPDLSRPPFLIGCLGLPLLMQSFTLAGFLLALCIQSVSADFVVKETVQNLGRNQDVTIKLKDNHCRIDANPETTALLDTQSGVTTILLHQTKMFLNVKAEELGAEGNALKKLLSQQTGNEETVDFQPTGKKEQINGYDTDEFVGKIAGLSVRVQVAKDFPNYQALLSALYAAQNAPGLNLFRALSIPPDKYPGMPIRTTIEVLGQPVVTTVDYVQQSTLSESEFAIPEGYTELKPSPSPVPSATTSPSQP